MATYTVPQVLINQLISEVSLNTVANQNVLVIGPNYELYRFDDLNTKSKIYAGRYDGEKVVRDDGLLIPKVTTYNTDYLNRGRLQPGNLDKNVQVVPYPGNVNGLVPDKTYTKVFLDDAVIQLTDNITGNIYTAINEAKSDFLQGRLSFSTSFTGTLKGKPLDLESDETDSTESVGTNDTPDTNTVTANALDADDVPVMFSIKRDIKPGDAVIIKTTTGGTITSTIVSVESDTAVAGVNNVLQLADSFTKDDIDRMYLGTNLSHIEIQPKRAPIGQYNWDAYSDTVNGVYGVTVAPDMTFTYNNWGDTPKEYAVVSGKVYIEHRDLVTSTASIDSIAHPTKVKDVLGFVHPDNPLAYGVYMAALNSGNKLVYYCGLVSDDIDGYNNALNKATLTDQVYIICPTTMDKSVITAVQEHVTEMSKPENKLWRISFVSQEAPEQIPILGGEATEEVYYAKPIKLGKDDDKTPEQFSALQLMEGAESTSVNKAATLRVDVQAGDVVRFYNELNDDTWDDTPGYTEFTVSRVISNTVLELAKPLTAGMMRTGSSGKNFRVEVYRPLKGQTRVKYLADMSSAMASRRMYNVFPHLGVTSGVEYSGAFLACAVGGLVSSVLPQQSVTNVELNGIDGIPSVYTTYKKADLDTIAAGGTFILMQERPGAKVYVRHQISTEYTSSNLMKAELSITKNLDSISYYFAEIFAPLTGKYNITPELIEVIRSKLETGLSALESGTGAGLYGPQVLVDGTEIVELRQSDVNKDHVYARVKLNLPVPFNYFDLDLVI